MQADSAFCWPVHPPDLFSTSSSSLLSLLRSFHLLKCTNNNNNTNKSHSGRRQRTNGAAAEEVEFTDCQTKYTSSAFYYLNSEPEQIVLSTVAGAAATLDNESADGER